jgi:hypothetical protein
MSELDVRAPASRRLPGEIATAGGHGLDRSEPSVVETASIPSVLQLSGLLPEPLRSPENSHRLLA